MAVGASGAVLAAGLSVVVWQHLLAVGSAGVAQWEPPLRVWWILMESSQMAPGWLLRAPLLLMAEI